MARNTKTKKNSVIIRNVYSSNETACLLGKIFRSKISEIVKRPFGESELDTNDIFAGCNEYLKRNEEYEVPDGVICLLFKSV